MNHQLVLQFRDAHLNAIVAAEDALIAHLGKSVEVDGHDFGWNEANIFVLTNEPAKTFQKAFELLAANPSFPKIDKAATWLLDADDYTVLWPLGETAFQIT